NIHVSSSTTYSPETKSFFARDLFLKNVFPLQGYVNPTTKEWRKNLIRWLIPLAFEFVFLAIIMIGISFSFTYTQNLINSSNTVAKRISSLGNAITSTDISELQNQIDSLKSFHIFPWRGQRLKVAKALERKFFIDFPIKVVKEPGGNEKPKALSNVILYEENHSDKQVKTDKNGEAILRAFKGKNTSQICIKVDHQEAGFGIDKVMIETEGNQSEQMLMEPLLKLDARSIYHNVLILYSKIRVLVAQIYNDKRAPVSNVPVSISDPAIPFPLANSFSDDIGTARLEFHSKDNAILNVEFGESDIGYPSAKHLRIDPGKYDYAMEEMIRTKPSGSDLIAESSKEDAIQTNPLGKSIKLVTKSKEPVPSAEVWIFIDNETLFKNTKEKDRIQIDLPGKRYRLVRCKDKTNNSGQLMLPTSAQTLLLLYNPKYWPRVIRIDQINKPIEMFDIHNERLIVEDFDQSLVEGAKYLYNQGRREYKYHRLNSAILLYEKAIRLVPMKEYYWALALAYSDSGKKEQALDVVSRGLDINLKDSEKQNKKYQDELENLRKKLKSKR
ncbi:MAG: hypothetical protein QG641_818, partial [Candidatus Poribacteria bacterium]|nr:hypothetical protein [Candidatus Poribacteria bacterium]